MPNETSQIPNPLKCWFTLFLQGNFLVIYTLFGIQIPGPQNALEYNFFINIRYSKPGSVSPLPELRLNCKSKLMGEWNTLIDLLQQLYKIFPCCCHANSISESNLDLILTTHIVSWKIFRP